MLVKKTSWNGLQIHSGKEAVKMKSSHTMKKLLSLLVISIIVLSFFKSTFLHQFLPIPSDTIVGLYYPFRDIYAATNPNGVPFKNFLITDPIRQQYPWRSLAIELEKKSQLPLWDPYSFAGSPLLANGQSAPLYPLNVLFFILPFSTAWTILIILEPLLGGIFLYLYLKNLRLHAIPSLVGSVAFAFSGFFVSWLEWNTVVQVAVWLPLLLLSIDKISSSFRGQKIPNKNLKVKRYIVWAVILVFSVCSAFFAGHLQTFFYLFLITNAYFLCRWITSGRDKKLLLVYILLTTCYILLTAVQWIPLLQFINLSARNIDQNWHQVGWFIPWQNLLQFIAPDFFGNPATGNYWGIWNYAEFVGYVGIIPLLFSLFALFFRHDKKTLFFGTLFFLSLIFALPTLFAQLPFIFSLPFLSTAQPTRLLIVADFSLAVLSALGLDYFLYPSLRDSEKPSHANAKKTVGFAQAERMKIFYPLGFLLLVFVGIWVVVLFNGKLHIISLENVSITKHNIYVPTVLFSLSCLLVVGSLIFASKKRLFLLLASCFLLLTIFDIYRFAAKFETFAPVQYLYPDTKITAFLQSHLGLSRIMTTDDRILPPNFSAMYHLQSVDGYDPLYLLEYGELIAASERKRPDITPPFGFHRIITPHNYDSKIMDLLGVKYVMSLSDINDPKLQKVFQDGQTRIYENSAAFPRAIFVGNMRIVFDKQAAMNELLNPEFSPATTAIVTCPNCNTLSKVQNSFNGPAKITHYTENSVTLNTDIPQDTFLVLFDQYYPTWHATVDGLETTMYQTDFSFRGIVVPKGKHAVVFQDSLF